MHWFEIFLFTLAICFLLSGADDLIIDIVHLFWAEKPDKRTPSEWKAIDGLPQQSIAVMVPAWSEHEVIAQMVRTNTRRIDYANYQWFIGVYPNDALTLAEGRKLESEFPGRVQIVLTDKPGPTSKAHCLNQVFRAICEKANQTKWEPELIALHDAEDVVHPDSFKAINSLPLELQFFQIPIFSLHTPLTSLVSGTYMDEFAENHLKEIPARQHLGMPIPSAGVGTFVRFTTLLRAQEYFGFVFNEHSLTEDYDLSMRLAYIGTTQRFVTLRTRDQKRIIATHGYFPDQVKTSVRQKTRWIIGITLQGVHLLKPKTFAKQYGRFRDRKGLMTNVINLLGWIGFVSAIAMIARHEPLIIIHERFLEQLFYANFMILLIRVVQRFRFTFQIYGLGHACLGVFRILLVNFINMLATFRAIDQYTRSKPGSPARKKPIQWDKTQHRFPDSHSLPENEPVRAGDNP